MNARPTVDHNGNTYYALPASMPRLSAKFRTDLGAQSRCNNCANNADALFPSHIWRHCPFFTSPHRKQGWPEHHSPVQSIAASVPSCDAPPTPSPVPSTITPRPMRTFLISLTSAALAKAIKEEGLSQMRPFPSAVECNSSIANNIVSNITFTFPFSAHRSAG